MLPAAGLDLPWFSPCVLTSGGVKGKFPDTDSDVCLVHPNQLGFLALRNCTGGIKSSRYRMHLLGLSTEFVNIVSRTIMYRN